MKERLRWYSHLPTTQDAKERDILLAVKKALRLLKNDDAQIFVVRTRKGLASVTAAALGPGPKKRSRSGPA